MEHVVRKLELRIDLTAEERRALATTFSNVRIVERHQDLFLEGERPAFVGAVLDGLLCRYKGLPGGERQILGLPLPGDLFDLHSFLLDKADHSIAGLTKSRVAVASHSAVHALLEAYPRLRGALWRDAAIEACILREWIVNCGRRSAYERTAHLFCELFVRMSEIGLTKGGGYRLPLTQVDLADALGVSVVHINRVLQQLRAKGFVDLRGGRLEIQDWWGLAEAGSFVGDYLNATDDRVGHRGSAFSRAAGAVDASPGHHTASHLGC